MKQITALPAYSFELVDELNALFPARCVTRTEDLRDADRYAGKRELVDFLLALKKKQEDAALNKR